MKRRLFATTLLAFFSSVAVAGEPHAFLDDSWKAIRAAHAGHPTIVHFWGLTCGPCRVEMANWGTLIAKRRGFDFVTVDTDMVPTPAGQAAAFLAKAGVPETDEAWRFDDGFAEKLYFAVDPKWQGEIPMTVLIGRDGRMKRMTGAADANIVEAWLDAQQVDGK